MKIFFVAALIFTSTSTFSTPSSNDIGLFGDKNIIDLSLYGKPATDLYRKLDVTPQVDQYDQNVLFKSVGSVTCMWRRSDANASCTIHNIANI